jgi:hypothetical protein
MDKAKSAEVFRFPSAVKRDPAVDAWLAAQAGELGSIARTWFAQIRRSGRDVRELLHDGCPVACVGDAAFAYVNVFKAHVNVGFFQGASLDDPFQLLTGTGRRMRHVTLRPDVPGDGAALSRLIEDAYAAMKGSQGSASAGP